MINKNNTAIIFGCSPFVNELDLGDIENLVENYYNIGINGFIYKCPKVKNLLFSDYNVYDWISPIISDQNIIISNTAYHNNFVLENREKPNNIEFIFDARAEIFHDLSLNMLAMYKTSALPAVNYCYLKGFKNIVLCGIDLETNWPHFYEEKNTQIRPIKRILKMRNLLYEFKNLVNLYQLNPNSDLDIKKINIGDLK